MLSNSSGGLYSVAASAAILFIIYVIYWFRGKIERLPSLIGFVCAAVVLAGGFAYMMKNNDDFRSRVDTVVNNGNIGMGYTDIVPKTHMGTHGALFLIEQVINGLMSKI